MSKRKILLADHIGLEEHLDDGRGDAVLTTSGGLYALFSVAGVYPDTADAIDINHWFDQVHSAYQSIYHDTIQLTSYLCRGEAAPLSSRLHSTSFGQELENDYLANLTRRTLYENELYLGIQVHSPNAVRRSVSQFIGEVPTDPVADLRDRYTQLSDICSLLQTLLSRFGLRRLGVSPEGRDEIAEALLYATLGIRCRIEATTGRMADAMFTEELDFRPRRCFEIDGSGALQYGVMFAIKEHPTRTWPGRFNTFASAAYRCTVAQSFRCMSMPSSMDLINRKQNKNLLARDRARTQTAELDHAADKVQGGELFMGTHSMVVLGFADRIRATDMVANAIWKDLGATGIKPIRLTKTLQAGWLSMLPDGEEWQPRPMPISSVNYVAYSPFYNFPRGTREGHLGTPLTTFRTAGGTPYPFYLPIFDPNNTENSNILVTGASGSGKTTSVGFLIAMTASRARIIALEHKRGWRRLTQRLGGHHTELGAGAPNFAPFKGLDVTPVNIDFLIRLWRGCIGGKMTQEEDRRAALWINTVWPKLPRDQRTVGEFRSIFDDNPEGAGRRLEPWIWGSELGWVLDAPEDNVRLDLPMTTFDTTNLLDNQRAAGPSLAYIFHSISLAADGSPLFIPIDEGHRVRGSDFFVDQVELSGRTIRSKNGALAFVTQSPSDLKDNWGRILIEQSPTQLHFANPRGRKPDYTDILSFTEGEWEAFHELQSGLGMFLLRQGEKSLIAQLPLHGMDKHIPVLSAPEAVLREEDNVIPFQQAAE